MASIVCSVGSVSCASCVKTSSKVYPSSPIVTVLRRRPSRIIPLFFSLPKIIFSPWRRTIERSSRTSRCATFLCTPSLKMTQFTKTSTTAAPLCFAQATIHCPRSFISISNERAKKRPRAPKQSSAGINGSSTVPKGELLETNPRSDVGEYCPLVRP